MLIYKGNKMPNIKNLSVNDITKAKANYDMEVAQINGDMEEIYNAFISLQQYWTGEAMNAVIKEYNTHRQHFYTDLNYLVEKVPNVLQNIASQYNVMIQKGEKQDFEKSGNLTSRLQDKMPLTSADVLKFQEKKVRDIVENTIRPKITSVMGSVDKIKGILDDLIKKSDMLEKMVKNYQKCAGSIKSTLGHLEKKVLVKLDEQVGKISGQEKQTDTTVKGELKSE